MFKFFKGLFSTKPEEPKTTPKPAKTEPYVFVTLHGSKFHYDPDCPSLRNAKTYKMDLSKARAAGRKACDKCCYGYLHEDL